MIIIKKGIVQIFFSYLLLLPELDSFEMFWLWNRNFKLIGNFECFRKSFECSFFLKNSSKQLPVQSQQKIQALEKVLKYVQS